MPHPRAHVTSKGEALRPEEEYAKYSKARPLAKKTKTLKSNKQYYSS